ncbi:MAG: hypothetical protein HY376_01880 [Candidatus Blackburnbacteria bacterium]|nr:hypothetical protein [Candidatus Blackburnbacteria bacterium]
MKEESTKGKELGLKEVQVGMGLFEFDVIFVVGEYLKMEEYVNWKFENKEFQHEHWDIGHEPRGSFFHRRGYVPVIWIPKKPRTPREHATLAHECLHAVFFLFEWANLPMGKDNEEVMTHAMAHLYANVLEKL